MNHIESVFTGKNNLWRYVVMIAIIFIVTNSIGSLPLLIGIAIKSASNPSVFTQLAASPNNYSVLGINPNILLILILFPFIAGLAAFMLLVKPIHGRTLKSTINGTGKIRWSRFFISAFIWLLLSAIYLFICLKLDPANFTLKNTNSSIIILSLISLLLIPFQAAFEEVLFRGYLLQGFVALVRNRWFPLIMTSILFGLMHAFNPEVKEFGFLTMILQYILFGLIFGIIAILDDGIEAALGAHSANNIFLCIMLTNKSSVLQTQSLYEQHIIYPWIDLTGLIFSGIIFIIVLKIIFKWDDFSILFGKVKVWKPENQIP
jgi:uncharacterized protein